MYIKKEKKTAFLGTEKCKKNWKETTLFVSLHDCKPKMDSPIEMHISKYNTQNTHKETQKRIGSPLPKNL